MIGEFVQLFVLHSKTWLPLFSFSQNSSHYNLCFSFSMVAYVLLLRGRDLLPSSLVSFNGIHPFHLS
jgi:hypothetical protein